MSFQEFIKQQIHAMMLDLAERIADGEFGEMSEDEMCSVPIFIFSVENCLIKAVRLFFAERR